MHESFLVVFISWGVLFIFGSSGLLRLRSGHVYFPSPCVAMRRHATPCEGTYLRWCYVESAVSMVDECRSSLLAWSRALAILSGLIFPESPFYMLIRDL